MFMGEKFGRDSIWETHLANELWNTDVELDAVLDEIVMPLHDVLNLKPGSRILLNAMPTSTIDMPCGHVSLFSGKMGRKRSDESRGGQGCVRQVKYRVFPNT